MKTTTTKTTARFCDACGSDLGIHDPGMSTDPNHGYDVVCRTCVGDSDSGNASPITADIGDGTRRCGVAPVGPEPWRMNGHWVDLTSAFQPVVD